MRYRIFRARRLFGISLTLLAALLVGGPATATEIHTVKLTYNGPPDRETNSVHLFAETFKDLVATRTDGKVNIVLYPNSDLGDEDQRMKLATSTPVMDIASLAGMEKVFPEIFVGNVPFMFDSYDAARWFFRRSPFWEKAVSTFHDRTGAYLLSMVEDGGFLAFTNSARPIHTPDDFEGLTFRAMDEAQLRLFSAFGAKGEQIAWTNLYQALQDGDVQGQMNPPIYIILGRLFEVQKYVTLANVQYSPQFLVVNGKWLDGLSEAQQEAVRRSAVDANTIGGIWVEARFTQRVHRLSHDGMEVYTPNASDMKAFRDRAVTAFKGWLAERFDAEWIELAADGAREANRRATAQ